MATKSQQPKGQDDALSSLNVAIDDLDLAKSVSTITPAKAAFDSTSVLLSTIRDSMINEVGYVELGLACADVCQVLDRGINGKRVNQPTRSVRGAIERLTVTAEEIQRNIIKRGKRNVISQRFHKKKDNETIASWRLDLNKIRHVFNTELEIKSHPTDSEIRHSAANTHTIVSGAFNDISDANKIVPDLSHGISNTHVVVSDIHQNTLKSRENTVGQNSATHASAPGESPPTPRHPHKTGATISEVHRDVVNTQVMVRDMLRSQQEAGGQDRSTQNRNRSAIPTVRESSTSFASSTPGESPPPPPRIFFGRDELIEQIVDFAERLTPIALIGAGGIGKTSVALTVLHDDRIKQRFGDNRRFVRCDKFPASLPHFLRQLSKTIGASVENAEDLTPLRPFLSSRDMFIVLDNAESVLDPRGTNAEEIYEVVEELSQLSNICLCITSRISTVPPDCKWLDISTLSMGAACDTFYRIYQHGEHSDLVDNILKQLDFHPLSITLLATVAHHNKWDTDRLAREWDKRRTGMLETEYNKNLAAAIELSLSSLMFQELGPDARDLLGVVAFFPQGVDENNIDWLFPTISGRKKIFDKICVLSLAYRSDGFITMLAPIRDYLSPEDPASAPLLCSAKDRYFSRLSVDVDPRKPGFGEAKWIVSEDVNVEHLLDVFTTIYVTSSGVWSACCNFMNHLLWHKVRLVILGRKIEALADGYPLKLKCTLCFSKLLLSVGNYTECKRLLTHALKLSRERGDDHQLAQILEGLSLVNSVIGLSEEAMQQAKEASEIFGRFGGTTEQTASLLLLIQFFFHNNQLDAAEEATSRAIDLFSSNGEQLLVCTYHYFLGTIHQSKGELEKAVHHCEVALGIASPFNWLTLMVWANITLAQLFHHQGRVCDAYTHVEYAKLHATTSNNAYGLAHAMELQARIWHGQRRLEEARSEAFRAINAFEKLGAAKDMGNVMELLRHIDHEETPNESDDDESAAESE